MVRIQRFHCCVLGSIPGQGTEIPQAVRCSQKEKTMKQQKNMLQMKEQGKNLQDQINEDEIGNLPEKEFSVMMTKMIQNLGNRIENTRNI